MQHKYAIDYKTSPPAWHAWSIPADSPEQALKIVARITVKDKSLFEVRWVFPN